MTAEVTAQRPAEQPGLKPTSPGFFGQFLNLALPYWNSDWRTRGILVLFVALTMAQVVIPILVNLWSANLFNALEQRSMDRFVAQAGALLGILALAMTITSTHLVVKRRMQIGWRRWLTRQVLDDWMAESRHYLVSHMPGDHDNPDGRISEDIRNTCESAIDLAHSLFYCLLLLISFIQILWSLSGVIIVTLFDTPLPIPGHMVFVSILYASAGTTAAVLLGRPLVSTVNMRQTVEANFRFGLVRVRENSEAIALLHGEPDERRRLSDLFTAARHGFNLQTTALAKVFVFSSGYSVLATGFPFLIAAPRYISGAISLGELMQIAQAFQQMTSALSWPVDNLSKAAEWKASVERVLSLHNALQELKRHQAVADQTHTITVVAGDRPALVFNDLCVSKADGSGIVSNFSETIEQGERVLISGDPGAAIKLFKVVAGLWPWGCGHVLKPNDADIFFMPQRPYLPIARLRSVLAYPAGPDNFEQATLAAALDRVGLSHLTQVLEDTTTWDNVLTLGEQQRLGFARLLLHRPNWIFIQEATDGLHADGEHEMMQLVREEFPTATVITVGYHSSLEAYHERKLSLEPSKDGPIQVKASPLDGSERRRKMSPLDLRNWLIHPLRRQTERRDT
ncbi:MAG: ABC transporter ATP-binding protein/permease [Rhodospirillaceae bacterium]|nr:ABC transporter ATP-binding protein/permease [Rhodospirillales bacterium]